LDPPIAGQVARGAPSGPPSFGRPTQFFFVVRTLPTAVDEFTMGLWHYIAISETYRVC
jgi:hypothetical protein